MADPLNTLLPKTRQEVVDLLTNEPHYVTFAKVDGSERRMLCTLDPDLMPGVDGETTKPAKNTVGNKSVNVYDMEKEEWRAFVIERVLKFEPA